jgi:hypothetical protein
MQPQRRAKYALNTFMRCCARKILTCDDSVQDVFKTFGDNVNQTKLEHMKAQMAAFKDNLSKFAIKHR